MKEEVRQKVMERFSISEQAMRLLLESAEMMSFVPKDIRTVPKERRNKTAA